MILTYKCTFCGILSWLRSSLPTNNFASLDSLDSSSMLKAPEANPNTYPSEALFPSSFLHTASVCALTISLEPLP